MRRTWNAKLERARLHLADLERRCDELQEHRTHIGSEVQHQNDELVVRGFLPLPPRDGDPDATIVGDLVANMRDSLDHVFSAISTLPDATFPIFVHEDAEKWAGRTAGLSADVKTILLDCQPYLTHPAAPHQSLLAILQRISNADKHRTLHVVARRLYRPTTTVYVDGAAYVTYDEPRIKEDGAIVSYLPVTWDRDAEVRVTVEAGIDIGITESQGRGWSYDPRSFQNLLSYIVSIVRELEPYAVL